MKKLLYDAKSVAYQQCKRVTSQHSELGIKSELSRLHFPNTANSTSSRCFPNESLTFSISYSAILTRPKSLART